MYPNMNTANPKCSVEIARRPAIKLPPGAPQIIVCIPVGAKEERHFLEIPPCGNPNCKCENHGKGMHRDVRNQGLVSFEFAMSHMQWVVPLVTSMGYLCEKGKLAAAAREDMTHRALELGCKYVFYLDDDVILPAHAFYQMHVMMERNPDIGLLTGVVCTREDPTEPLLYKEQGRGAYWDFSIDPNASPEDIWAAGGGCLMVRADALKQMTPPFWADVRSGTVDPLSGDGNAVWGHDIYFINKLRSQTGLRTCVMGSVLCGHWDLEKQKLYELPKDSPPYRKTAPKPDLRPVFGVETCPPLTVEYLADQLRFSEYGRRLFIVEKSAQSKRDMTKALSMFFNKVRILDVEEQWLGIGEGLKNGHLSISGDSAGDHQLGDVSSDNGSSPSRPKHRSRKPTRKGSHSASIAPLHLEGND